MVGPHANLITPFKDNETEDCVFQMSRITSVLHVFPNQYAFLAKSVKYMAESMQIDLFNSEYMCK